jgi:hypothetical protein
MGGTLRGPRLTQPEAAEQPGVSVEAIRKRVKRGTLRCEKREDGRRYVYLAGATDDAHPRAKTEEPSSPLVAEPRDRVGYLREQLRRGQGAHAGAQRIIVALTSRIPELELSSERRESDLTGAGEPERAEPRPAAGCAQESTKLASWWWRIFGS